MILRVVRASSRGVGPCRGIQGDRLGVESEPEVAEKERGCACPAPANRCVAM